MARSLTFLHTFTVGLLPRGSGAYCIASILVLPNLHRDGYPGMMQLYKRASEGLLPSPSVVGPTASLRPLALLKPTGSHGLASLQIIIVAHLWGLRLSYPLMAPIPCRSPSLCCCSKLCYYQNYG